MIPAFLALLFWAILAIWVDPRWPWAIYQLGIFGLAAYRLARVPDLQFGPCGLLTAAAAWPALQAALGQTLSAGRSAQASLDWLTFAVTFWLARELFKEPDVRRPTLRAISCFGLLLGVVAMLQQATSPGLIFWHFPSGFTDGVMGPFVNRNQFAAWVELVFPVTLFLAFNDRTLRALHLASAAILFGSAVACVSRAGFAMICLEVVLVVALSAVARAIPRRKLFLTTIQLLLVAAAAGTAAGWHTLAARFGGSGSELLRREAINASLQMIRDRPFTGYGLGTWSMAYPRYASFDSGVFLNQAHNDWLQWAAEGGLPFAFIVLAFALLLWKPAFRSIYGSGTVVVLLHALVDYPMQQRPALTAWVFALSGAAMAVRQEIRAHDGLLRRTGGEPGRDDRGDPQGLQATGSSAAS